MNTEFKQIKELVNEYDELQRFVNELQDSSNNIGVIHSNYDGPGINYTTYSEKNKQLIISALKIRMAEITKYFN